MERGSKTPAYDAQAVQREIDRDRRIGGREGKLIHSLLRGRGRG